MIKLFNGIEYEFDPCTNKYLNPETNKWVLKPRSSKGKSIKIIESKEFRYIHFKDFQEFDNNINQRLNVFLTKLIEKYNTIRSRRIKDDRSYDDVSIYFSTKDLIYILGKNYTKLLNYLVDINLVEKVYNKITRFGYPLNYYKPIFLPKTIEYKYVDIYKVQKSLTLYYKINERKLGELKPIVEQMFNIKIDIKERKFKSLLTEYYHRKKRKISLDQYLNNAMILFAKICNWNSASTLEKYNFFCADEFSGRLHSIFTELPQPIRKYITKFDSAIDMVAAQPTLLADHIINEFSGLFTEKFVNDVISSDIYMTIKDKFNLNSRNAAKKLLYKVFFGKEYYKEVVLFNQMYPCAGYILSELRREHDDYNNVAKILQSKEVDIFKKIWFNLKELKINFITIHDEIMFNSHDKETVINVIRMILDKELSIRYDLKVS